MNCIVIEVLCEEEESRWRGNDGLEGVGLVPPVWAIVRSGSGLLRRWE